MECLSIFPSIFQFFVQLKICIMNPDFLYMGPKHCKFYSGMNDE